MNRVQQMELQIQSMIQELQNERTRTAKAEDERSVLIKTLGTRGSTTDIVDMKGIGQPFKLTGKPDQDFAEWTHKVKTFLSAKYNDAILYPLQWSARQKKVIVEKDPDNLDRLIAWNSVFGEAADDVDRVPA